MSDLSKIAEFIYTNLSLRNKGISKEEFYANNIVDFTDVLVEDMYPLDKAGKPSMCKDWFNYSIQNGHYAALPPFEEGSFIDRRERRFIKWKVLDVSDDHYDMELENYPLFADSDHPVKDNDCWFMATRFVVRVSFLDDEQRRYVLLNSPDIINSIDERFTTYEELMESWNKYLEAKKLIESGTAVYSPLYSHYSEMEEVVKNAVSCDNAMVGGRILEGEFYTPKAFEKIREKGKYIASDGTILNKADVCRVIDDSIKETMGYAWQSMKFVAIGPLIEAFSYLNFVLSSPETDTKTIRKISSSYALSEDDQEIRRERHFGKIKVVSEKKPKTVTKENVERIYTTLSWQRRSHLRHLKSGKVVPVKSSVCRRKGSDNTSDPKVIYKP